MNDGQLGRCDFFSEVDQILEKMDDHKRDQSFLEFLEECCRKSNLGPPQEEAKKWALSYVSGFNAADPKRVGVHWLVKGMRAEGKIEGQRAFRAEHGYADLIDIFQQQLNDTGVAVQKNTVVENIQWQPGRVQIVARGPNGTTTFSGSHVLITVPLGVLQARLDENGQSGSFPSCPKKSKMPSTTW